MLLQTAVDSYVHVSVSVNTMTNSVLGHLLETSDLIKVCFFFPHWLQIMMFQSSLITHIDGWKCKTCLDLHTIKNLLSTT